MFFDELGGLAYVIYGLIVGIPPRISYNSQHTCRHSMWLLSLPGSAFSCGERRRRPSESALFLQKPHVQGYYPGNRQAEAILISLVLVFVYDRLRALQLQYKSMGCM